MKERTISFSEATREAMIEEMELDQTVFLMGEDIAKQGGIFGQFKDLPQRFGLERVRDTPISEAVLVSSALGAALTGARPVIDIHFSDFLTCSMDEMINQIAKARYMFGGQAEVPLVIRAPEGAIRSAAAQHSQSLEAWFVHTPGWRVVSPSNPADAKGLLKSAIRSNDPVLYLEHKAMYTHKGPVPEGEHLVPIGKCSVARRGSDISILSWSLSLSKSLVASETLAERGVDAEVIDIRTLSPLDMEPILDSVRKTHRAVIVHEAVHTCGLGAEIAARVGYELFSSLEAPIERVANPDVPIPFSPSLEKAAIPQVEDVVAAVDRAMS